MPGPMSPQDEELNGVNLTELRGYIETARTDPLKTERNPTMVARWVGESRSRAEFGDVVTHLGGEGELNPMQALLASLAACDVDLIAMHASLLGIQIESLSVEATGHFNVRRYLGLDASTGPGYDRIHYTVRIHAPDATPEQFTRLREMCERASPVGDTLSRAISLTMELEAESSS